MAFEEKYVKQRSNNKFRGDYGHRLTKALFVDFYGEDKGKALYTLDEVDKVGPDGTTYPSLYRLFLEMGDLYERDFALKYFESWDHWKELRETVWLKPLLEKWRAELELQIRSEALLRIQMEASSNGKNSYNANLYLAGAKWKEEDTKPVKKGAGRPSKAQIQEEANKIAMDAHDVQKDLKRLGLN